MPIYEYRCEDDGTVVELIRPMSAADDPVVDPEGRGRTFRRVMSSFQATGGRAAGRAGGRSTSLPMGGGGCCPCGKGRGQCSSGG
jgi:putative FmdB family regulatory protein